MSMLKVPVTSNDHIQGNKDAPIILVEYGDYECPYCGSAYPIVKQIQKHFGKQLGFVFRNFPLNESHPHAELAAETAEFAAEHKKFWEMHDLLYENQTTLSLATMLELTKSLKLPVAELEKALESKKYQSKIRSDFLGGVNSGVNGTPTFYINGQRHNGSFEYEELVAAIDQANNAK